MSISHATLDAALKLSAECNHAFQDFLQIKLHSAISEANSVTHEWGILLILLILVFKAYLEITISLYIFICYHLYRQNTKKNNTQFPNECMYDLPWTKRNELANYRSEIIKLMATKIFTCCYQNKLTLISLCAQLSLLCLLFSISLPRLAFLPSHSPMGTGAN